MPTDIGFTGQRADSSTGLMFYGARYYSVYLNRWIQPDSIVPSPGDPQSLNRFSYARNNPLRYRDPTGHAVEETGGLGATCTGMYCLWGPWYQEWWATHGPEEIIPWNVQSPFRAGLVAESISEHDYNAVYQGTELQDVEGRLEDPANIAYAIPAAWKVGPVAARAAGSAITSLAAGCLTNPTCGRVAYGVQDQGIRWGPATGEGPLGEEVANTFRGGSYTELKLAQDTTLYRAWGGTAGEIGGYWTRTAPAGALQVQLDLALNPVWGNTAENVAAINVPAGTVIYEGFAASQVLPWGGILYGGGSQVVIPWVDPAWLVR